MIAADKPEVSAFYNLYDESQSQLKDLITNAPADSKYGTLYKSMMDEAVHRIARDRAAEGRPGEDRRDQDQGRLRRRHGRDPGRFGSGVFSLDIIRTPRTPINALNRPGRPRHARPRLLSVTDGFKPQREAYRAYHRAHLDDRLRPTRRLPPSPGLRDRDRPDELEDRRPPRHRQDEQSDDHRRAEGLCAGPRLGAPSSPAPHRRPQSG